VEEICQAGFTSLFAFPVYAPRSFVTCGHQASLGFGFPMSLGVKVAHPDKAVVSLAGDGGFQFGMQELATIAQYGINLTVIVFNNGAYYNVMRDQQRRFNGRVQSSRLRNPDFVKVAEACGVNGYKASTPAGLKTALEKALAEPAPALIEIAIEQGTEVSPWDFLQAP
jgi:acetolactate synthase-1/2/3 large subunit